MAGRRGAKRRNDHLSRPLPVNTSAVLLTSPDTVLSAVEAGVNSDARAAKKALNPAWYDEAFSARDPALRASGPCVDAAAARHGCDGAGWLSPGLRRPLAARRDAGGRERELSAKRSEREAERASETGREGERRERRREERERSGRREKSELFRGEKKTSALRAARPRSWGQSGGATLCL